MEVRAGLQILMLRSPYPELPLWPYPMDQMVTSLVNLLVEKITIGDAPLKQSLLPRFFFVPRSSGKYLIRIDLMHLNRFIPSPQFLTTNQHPLRKVHDFPVFMSSPDIEGASLQLSLRPTTYKCIALTCNKKLNFSEPYLSE